MFLIESPPLPMTRPTCIQHASQITLKETTQNSNKTQLLPHTLLLGIFIEKCSEPPCPAYLREIVPEPPASACTEKHSPVSTKNKILVITKLEKQNYSCGKEKP
jgi:hypothetical protein